MIDDALEIAAVTMIIRIAVERLIAHTGYAIVGRIAIAETVRHQQVHQIRRIDALCKSSSIARTSGFELIADLYICSRSSESKCTHPGFGIFINNKIQENIIGILYMMDHF